MNKINLYFSKALVIITAVFIVSSCSKDTENWGYVSKFSNINEVVPSQSTREDVQAKLGSPTSKSVYGKEKWFYIGSEVTKESFFDPKVLNHEVYTIVFNNDGVVESITKRGKDDMNEVALSNEITVTEGNEITVAQQFLGNLGKFNKDGATGGKRGGPTTRMPRY
jgi:outer membrane protein assembly factor BamE (lipoprotein component of BamABCDE complex)